ncbi:hypothetical protein I4U23_020107 [Adineta vaga]|nr:hypothetical protein I4U23_020107 [Adineta vaga]
MSKQADRHPACLFRTDKPWLDRQFKADGSIVKPEELISSTQDPPDKVDSDTLNRVHGSIAGMALGDALGAFVEFRPREFLLANPVKNLQGGGTWGLEKGQFTDDTSMALCLANSLIARQDFVPYDQLVRYKWWFKNGYMSSTGKCFDIGTATRESLTEFERRQNGYANKHRIPMKQMNNLSDQEHLKKFNVYCSREGVAGNGALMRLAPVPLFFHKHPLEAVAFSGFSGAISHGDRVSFDACRYYGALIVAAVHGLSKEELTSNEFYLQYQYLFNNISIHPEILKIAQGSYKRKGGYDQGIRGRGYVVNALEAALWSFSTTDSFETGAVAAVSLGDDTDTTAAIYGQLAGAYYGYKAITSGKTPQSYDDVFNWLCSINQNYKSYADALRKDYVDGFWLLNYIDDQCLYKKYGVKDEGHRRDILNSIEKLKLINSAQF